MENSNYINKMLTNREREILILCSHGLTNIQIASLLYISKHTVKHHIEHILSKLSVTTRTCAVIKAFSENIITDD